MRKASAAMTTAVTKAMEAHTAWFYELGAEDRSWITLVARAGIDGFIGWFEDDRTADVDASSIFNVAPRAMTRKIALSQTIDLIRTTLQVLESQIDELLPASDREPLQTALVHYSRDVAFAAAEVYARAAESRGAWDEHIESLIIDSIVRDEADDRLIARASTLGWPASSPVFVVIGNAPSADTSDEQLQKMRSIAKQNSWPMLVSDLGRRLAVIFAIQHPDQKTAVSMVETVLDCFGDGSVVIGPPAEDLAHAGPSAQEAQSGQSAACGWPEGPRIVGAIDLLPERALMGNSAAKRALLRTAYQPLLEAGGDLLETCAAFLDHMGSVEATARTLFVHANTVRYRIKRIHDVTGYAPSDSRDAYALRLAITLGRLDERNR
jgi:hypothetical protein